MFKLGQYEFKFCCASGALGYDGRGYWWDAPYRWLGLLRPEEFTIITKTLTLGQRDGNFRWWKYWETFQAKTYEYTVNAYGLKNPGLGWWLRKHADYLPYKTIVSICPFTCTEAIYMIKALNNYYYRVSNNIVGIELNISCPNTEECSNYMDIIETIVQVSWFPIIIKIGIDHEWQTIQKSFGNKIAGFDAINTVPWSKLRQDKSPLHPHNGGISGIPICAASIDKLLEIKRESLKIQVISGGGIYTPEQAALRFRYGANAISFGTLFYFDPSEPNRIISNEYNQC